jgi:hypothetical protein
MKLCKECKKELIKWLEESIDDIERAGYEHPYDQGYYDGLDNLLMRLKEGIE